MNADWTAGARRFRVLTATDGQPHYSATLDLVQEFEKVPVLCHVDQLAVTDLTDPNTMNAERPPARRQTGHVAGVDAGHDPLLCIAVTVNEKADGLDSQVGPARKQTYDVGAGRFTSREIAARLYISARTVDKHVERLIAKTGVDRRSQLRRFGT